MRRQGYTYTYTTQSPEDRAAMLARWEAERAARVLAFADVLAAGQPGDRIEVHSFGRWYRGTIVKVGRTRVTVDYTPGTGTRRVKTFGALKVRAVGPDAAAYAAAAAAAAAAGVR